MSPSYMHEGNVEPVTERDAERLEAAMRRAVDGVHDHYYVAGISTRWTRFKPKLKRAMPSLLLLAGCGVWAFAPQLMNSAGIGLFTAATLLNLVGCLRQ